MSTIRFFPIRWFEDNDWRSVQVIGQLENQQSVYLRIAFRPYFTIKYPINTSTETIEDAHTYLISETPIDEVATLDESQKVYRVFVTNKDDYFDSIKFYKRNGLGSVIDETQNIKSKFFAERKINPGSWQQATDLRTLFHNVTMNTNYTAYELEFYTKNVANADFNGPIPKCRTVFFDIEVIPSDNISFPDADTEGPVDSIFAFSLVDGNRNIVYILTDQNLPERFKQTQIIRANSEKELIQKFFEELSRIKPNRLVSMNGRHFDINYIGGRARNLGIKIPPFTPILSYEPFFYPKTIVQKEPFFSIDEVWALLTPAISQIDLLDFYRRLLPQLGNYKLETLGQFILGRGKTGLDIQEMFAKYRRGTVEDLLEIINYSITDSVLLYELWMASQIDQKLATMANEWKNDAEYVLTHDMDSLFKDLIHYVQPNTPEICCDPGKPITTERKSGIHRNVYIYSLSSIYLMFLQQLQDPLSQVISNYFANTNDGIIPFESGYFPVKFSQVQDFILSQISSDKVVWIEKNSLAVTGNSSDITFLSAIEYAPLVIVSQKSWILVNQSGMIFKKGLSSLIRPPFGLVERYVDYLIDFLIKYPGQPIQFPTLETTLDDFVMETKVTAENFVIVPKKKSEIIHQLRELNTSIPITWRKVYYIKTTEGDIIEEIYSQDVQKYANIIDQSYYTKILQNTLKTIF
jgi:uncharacterized protein YprB with RNaseH-like and TPR domain